MANGRKVDYDITIQTISLNKKYEEAATPFLRIFIC